MSDEAIEFILKKLREDVKNLTSSLIRSQNRTEFFRDKAIGYIESKWQSTDCSLGTAVKKTAEEIKALDAEVENVK